MPKKQRTKDSSGFVLNVQSKTVRAQEGSSKNMKEKIRAVREIIPNRSNTEIILVLQHFNNCVEKTVQAFIEGDASELLKEWTVTGKRKKDKKKKAKAPLGPDSSAKSKPEEENGEKGGIALNSFHDNSAAPDSKSLGLLSEGKEPGAALGNEIPTISNESLPDINALSLRSRPGSPRRKEMEPSLEKSLKDLQHCSVALAQLRTLVREEMENSLRKMQQAYAEIQSCIMDHEAALQAEVDKVRTEAMELLVLQQRRDKALRKLMESAPVMSEKQLLELRANIKHFLSEHMLNEEQVRARRGSIGAFGQESHPKMSYSSHSQLALGSGSGSSPGSVAGSGWGSGSALRLGSTLGSSPGSVPGSGWGSGLPSQRSRIPGSGHHPLEIPGHP